MTDKKKYDCKKILKSLSKNYWTISTVILAIVLVIVLITGGIGNASEVSKDTVRNNILSFIENQGGEIELGEITDEGSFYQIAIEGGQGGSIFVTKDGNFVIQPQVELTGQVTAPTQQQEPTPTEIPKSDVPEVELYIWSYCPYGVAAQGPMAEVASLLGSSITTKTLMYYDGHGAYETQQNKIQACIQEVAPSKYNDYAAGFVKDIYPICGASRDIDCDLEESTTLMNSLGINSAGVLDCVETKGAQLIAEDSSSAQGKGVTGSPTIFINGVKAQVARTPEAIKTAICSAFNEAPEECGEQLDAAAAQASGSC